MRLKRKTRRFIGLLTAFLLLGCCFRAPVASATPINTHLYESEEPFTLKSIPQPITLTYPCDAISFCATCEGDVIDNITIHIEGKTDPSFHETFDIDTDGESESIPYYLPAGRYIFYAVGNSTITKNFLLFVGTTNM